jgi:hypothetical protein
MSPGLGPQDASVVSPRKLDFELGDRCDHQNPWPTSSGRAAASAVLEVLAALLAIDRGHQ